MTDIEKLAKEIVEAHNGDPMALARECAILAIENERLEAAASAGLRRKAVDQTYRVLPERR